MVRLEPEYVLGRPRPCPTGLHYTLMNTIMHNDNLGLYAERVENIYLTINIC